MELINDFDTSVKKAFDEINPKWEELKGLVVCGSHSPANVEDTLKKIEQARRGHIPFLGICAGMQFMVIEFCRNVLRIDNATSEELSPYGTHVITRMPELRVGMKMVRRRMESHWHNYKVKDIIALYEYFDVVKNEEDNVIEEMRLVPTPSFFIGVQYHPEYQSSLDKPHPLLVQFLNACNAVSLHR